MAYSIIYHLHHPLPYTTTALDTLHPTQPSALVSAAPLYLLPTAPGLERSRWLGKVQVESPEAPGRLLHTPGFGTAHWHSPQSPGALDNKVPICRVCRHWKLAVTGAGCHHSLGQLLPSRAGISLWACRHYKCQKDICVPWLPSAPRRSQTLGVQHRPFQNPPRGFSFCLTLTPLLSVLTSADSLCLGFSSPSLPTTGLGWSSGELSAGHAFPHSHPCSKHRWEALQRTKES